MYSNSICTLPLPICLFIHFGGCPAVFCWLSLLPPAPGAVNISSDKAEARQVLLRWTVEPREVCGGAVLSYLIFYNSENDRSPLSESTPPVSVWNLESKTSLKNVRSFFFSFLQTLPWTGSISRSLWRIWRQEPPTACLSRPGLSTVRPGVKI